MKIPGIHMDMGGSFCLKDRTLQRKEDYARHVSNATMRLRRGFEDSAQQYIRTRSRRHHQ